MKNKNFVYNLFLILLIFASLFLILFQNISLTGNLIEDSIPSNVSINKYLAISFSSNLSQGIYFGTIEVLPALNLNATENYGSLINGTEYYINVSSDSNTIVDFCIKAGGDMENIALDKIGLGNETYSNSTLTNSSLPDLVEDVSLTTSYVKSGVNVPIGGVNYYRFWLDIPASQPSGDYNNTISFKGIESGSSC